MLFLFSFYLIIYLSLFSPVIHNIGMEFNNCYKTTNLNMIIDLFDLRWNLTNLSRGLNPPKPGLNEALA